MKLLKNIRLLYSTVYFKYVSASLLALTTFSHAQSFTDCFPGKFNFNCQDPYNFLLQSGIDVEKNIIDQSRLQLLNQKFSGGCTGGVFKGSHNTYFIKRSNLFSELIGSKLMNLIVGTKVTPVVKVVRDQANYIASTKLKNFVTRKELQSKRKLKHKIFKGEIQLAIAMDFLGLVDRHSKNLGCVKKYAARVDFDASFAFEIRPRANSHYRETSNHLNLNLLFLSMQTYPEQEVIQAIRKIVEIPDEKIIMTIFECWSTFSRIGNPISLDSCFALAKKLIERKNAFQSILEDPNAATYFSLQEDPIMFKLFKELKRKKEKHRHRKKKHRHY